MRVIKAIILHKHVDSPGIIKSFIYFLLHLLILPQSPVSDHLSTYKFHNKFHSLGRHHSLQMGARCIPEIARVCVLKFVLSKTLVRAPSVLLFSIIGWEPNLLRACYLERIKFPCSRWCLRSSCICICQHLVPSV